MPQALLSDLQARGISVFLADKSIKVRGSLTDSDRERIKRHKAELLSFLRDQRAQLPQVETITPVSVAAISSKLNSLGCIAGSDPCRELDFVDGKRPFFLCMAFRDRSVNVEHLERCPRKGE